MNMFDNQGFIKILVVAVTIAVSITTVLISEKAEAEYADVVINNYADSEGMRPVVFPHWFHRIRFRCKVCHADLGFKFKAGGNKIKMINIIEGEFCGACHNGEIAWAPENCDLCHSAPPGTPTQIHGSTSQTLVAPIGEQPKSGGERVPQAIVIEGE